MMLNRGEIGSKPANIAEVYKERAMSRSDVGRGWIGLSRLIVKGVPGIVQPSSTGGAIPAQCWREIILMYFHLLCRILGNWN